MPQPPERRRSAPDECEPGDYIHAGDLPEWRDAGAPHLHLPGHESGPADPFNEDTYKMVPPADWKFEQRTITDATGTTYTLPLNEAAVRLATWY